MTLLAHATYDPGSAVSKSTASLLAMTALDTTNLRCTFTAPANGTVLVRLRCLTTGAATAPRILLGVLDGATVKFRQAPFGQVIPTSTIHNMQEAVGVITGLTPGSSFTWDAAYGVEVVLASTNIKYGGPNDTTGADAWGAFAFEVWDCPNLLAGKSYDPGTLATNSMTSLLAMTAMDTTNLRLTFTAPSTGKIWWRLRVPQHGGNPNGQALLGILEGASVVARQTPVLGTPTTTLATSAAQLEASGMITGLSAGSHTYDAAYAVQVVSTAGGLRYGGPNDTTSNNALGAACFEIWDAS